MQTHEEKVASFWTYLMGTLAALSGLSLNQWGVVIGIGLGLGTFAVNLWFKWHILRIAKKNGEVNINVD